MVFCCSAYFILLAQFNYYFNCSWENKNELLLTGGPSEPRMLKKQPKHLKKHPLHRAALSGMVNWELYSGRLICTAHKNPVREKVIDTHESKMDLHLESSQYSWTKCNLQTLKMDIKGNYKFHCQQQTSSKFKDLKKACRQFLLHD